MKTEKSNEQLAQDIVNACFMVLNMSQKQIDIIKGCAEFVLNENIKPLSAIPAPEPAEPEKTKPVTEKLGSNPITDIPDIGETIRQHVRKAINDVSERITALEQQLQVNVTEERVHDIACEHVKNAFEAFRDGIEKLKG